VGQLFEHVVVGQRGRSLRGIAASLLGLVLLLIIAPRGAAMEPAI
jgi:hypothetical protein